MKIYTIFYRYLHLDNDNYPTGKPCLFKVLNLLARIKIVLGCTCTSFVLICAIHSDLQPKKANNIKAVND